MSDLIGRLEGLEREFHDLEARLGDPSVVADHDRFVEMSRRYSDLKDIVDNLAQLRSAEADIAEARELISASDGDDREMWRSEASELETSIERLTEELKVMLLPKDPNDDRNVIIEIRGAEGGEEANLFAKDLFDMYRSYAEGLGLSVRTISVAGSDMGGFAEVTFSIAGERAWSRFKYEAGVHRVQRVPVTESQGRVHTSSATVVVLPEAAEVDVKIDPGDLQIDVYRSSGPGGQSVNTTDSAVRITHIPTGVVVAMQDEKSQQQNRAKALTVLRSRLLKLEQDRHEAEESGKRRAQIGGGGRSEKIRTYNFKENRVSDHRIGLTVYNLDKVLEGELGEINEALIADARARQLAGEGR